MTRHGLEPLDPAIIASLATGALALATAIERKRWDGAPRQRPSHVFSHREMDMADTVRTAPDSDRLIAKTRLKPKSP